MAQEDARAAYTGPVYAATSSATSSSAAVTLAATVHDITAVPADPSYDASAGDIRQATVTFVNRDAGDAPLCTADLVPVLVSASDPKTGTVTCGWTADIGSAGSEDFTIGIKVAGSYTRDASTDNAVVTVSRPITSFVTGGGYLVNATSSGLYAGDPGKRTNFGFNVKYNKPRTNLKGSFNAIVRSGGHVYQVKGNSMTSTAVQPAAATTSPATATKSSPRRWRSPARRASATSPIRSRRSRSTAARRSSSR